MDSFKRFYKAELLSRTFSKTFQFLQCMLGENRNGFFNYVTVHQTQSLSFALESVVQSIYNIYFLTNLLPLYIRSTDATAMKIKEHFQLLSFFSEFIKRRWKGEIYCQRDWKNASLMKQRPRQSQDTDRLHKTKKLIT